MYCTYKNKKVIFWKKKKSWDVRQQFMEAAIVLEGMMFIPCGALAWKLYIQGNQLLSKIIILFDKEDNIKNCNVVTSSLKFLAKIHISWLYTFTISFHIHFHVHLAKNSETAKVNSSKEMYKRKLKVLFGRIIDSFIMAHLSQIFFI